MKKVWLGLIALLPLAVACGSPGSAQGTGGSNGTGGTTPPLDSYEVPCDESHVTITESYDVVSTPDGYGRGELILTATSTSYYSWTAVENSRDAIVYHCDHINETTPPPPPPEPGSRAAASTEVTRDDPRPTGDCFINHGAEVDGNRILTRCTSVRETVYNKSFSEYDPETDVDTTRENGSKRILITGTRVTE